MTRQWVVWIVLEHGDDTFMSANAHHLADDLESLRHRDVVQHAYRNHDIECPIVERKLLAVVPRELCLRYVLPGLDQHLLRDVHAMEAPNPGSKHLIGR